MAWISGDPWVWLALFLAVPASLAPAGRRVGLALLALALAWAAADGWRGAGSGPGVPGTLGPPAAPALALLVVAAWAVAPARPLPLRVGGHMLFVALAIALSLHWAPGFHNAPVPEARLTADATPYRWYLNLDKPLIAFWLVLVLPWAHPRRPARDVAASAAAAGLGTSAVCLAAAMGLGMVAWSPKWPMDSGSWVALWLLNNLLLVTFAEEALFRGYVQGGLSRLLAGRRHGDLLALGISAALFGLAHGAGGLEWVVVAGIAGLGYGLAYRHGGLYAAMLAHFTLNVLHLFLFTYPMRDPSAAGPAPAAAIDMAFNYFIGFAYN